MFHVKHLLIATVISIYRQFPRFIGFRRLATAARNPERSNTQVMDHFHESGEVSHRSHLRVDQW